MKKSEIKTAFRWSAALLDQWQVARLTGHTCLSLRLLSCRAESSGGMTLREEADEAFEILRHGGQVELLGDIPQAP